ncbi:MAG: potassium-transporting ATPase subunit C [Thaumarchaeota archaeon]|nr:potassium-transporting ATPase subunit C [Nitrososphaerota archaeon]
MSKETSKRYNRYKPAMGIAIISLLICGLFFPLLITGIAQVTMPYQANGEIVKLNGQKVGSNLISNNFTLPIFFHTRNDSASGVDPDITVLEAYSQIPRISNASGISSVELTQIVNRNIQGMFWVFGNKYVNVLRINLVLIQDYPSVYKSFSNT